MKKERVLYAVPALYLPGMIMNEGIKSLADTAATGSMPFDWTNGFEIAFLNKDFPLHQLCIERQIEAERFAHRTGFFCLLGDLLKPVIVNAGYGSFGA